MTEPTAAESWLYQVLSQDAALTALVGARIYDSVAPRGAAYPLVIYAYQSGSDLTTLDARRIFSNQTYSVKAVDRSGSYNGIKPIAKRLDELLQRVSGSTPDGIVWGCYREGPIKFIETLDGIQYHYLGGLYRLHVNG